jgi:hypothetical protein
VTVQAGRTNGEIFLHTALLGTLHVPDGATRGSAEEPRVLASRAAVYATRARGEDTRRAYHSAWRAYEAGCRSLGREPLARGPELIAMYATCRADQGVAVSTLRVDLAAIRTAHLLAGDASSWPPAGRPRRHSARDRAMLLLSIGAALRRSELVSLRVGDVEPVPGRGLRLLVRCSKTDQHGKGQDVAVWANPADPLLCLATALDAWLAHRWEAHDLDWTAPEGMRPVSKPIDTPSVIVSALNYSGT